MAHVHLRELFAADPERGTDLAVTAGDLYIDYSKQRITADTLRMLAAPARRGGVEQLRDAMFAGEHINVTEDRAVLHVALRAPSDERIDVDGQDVVPAVHAVLDQMSRLRRPGPQRRVDRHTGERIRAVVNVGIGGSDLGPRMAAEALADFAQPDITARSSPTPMRPTSSRPPRASTRRPRCS